MQALPWSKLGRLFLTGVPSKTLWAATSFYRRQPDENEFVTLPSVSQPAIAVLGKTTIDAGATSNVDWSQTIAAKHDGAETDTTLWDLRALSHLDIQDEE
jgi:hypothetical protein